MDNIDNEIQGSNAEVEQLKLNAEEKFKEDLKIAGISNDNAIEDIIGRVSFNVIEINGKTKSYIRNNDGKVIDSDLFITNLKNQLPSYFSGYVSIDNSLGGGDTATLQDNYALNILEQIEEGTIKMLDEAQKETLLKTLLALSKPDYKPGSTKKKLGKYEAMDVHKLFRKAGGLKSGV